MCCFLSADLKKKKKAELNFIFFHLEQNKQQKLLSGSRVCISSFDLGIKQINESREISEN